MPTREEPRAFADHDDRLTAEVVFTRLEQLRELLRLTDYLREFRPVRPRGASDDADR